jgi:signal transduction histidine kinase
MDRMKKKLLHKTLRSYLIFSTLVLLIAAPLFYSTTQQLYRADAEETLLLRKHDFVATTLHHLDASEIPVWNKMNRDTQLLPYASGNGREVLYYKSYYDTTTEENEPYCILLSPIRMNGKPYLFSTRINLVETEDLIQSILVLFTVMMVLLLLGLYGITRWLSIRLWKPFYATLEQIEQFEIDKHTTLVFLPSMIEEFDRLHQSVSRVMERNRLIFKSQREFIENASHELQTPLAVFQANIDTLMQQQDITPEQAVLLEKLNGNVSRLNRLNRNLLLLSKIDGEQYDSAEDVFLKPLIDKHFDFFEEQAAAKNIRIAAQLSESSHVRSNPVLVEVLVSNLFMNAIRHNVPDGAISIVLTDESLTFSNSGIPEALPGDKLFQRFSKVNPSSEGNGLGLAIIQKIVAMNGWTISYAFAEGRHEFRVGFEHN